MKRPLMDAFVKRFRDDSDLRRSVEAWLLLNPPPRYWRGSRLAWAYNWMPSKLMPTFQEAQE